MTDHYAVIGNPIGHTKSPLIHRAFAEQTGQDIAYTALLAPLDGFAEVVDAFRRDGGRGLNVTAPFKLDAFAYAQECREPARLAGAVNAMNFKGEHVVADNFDGMGLVRDIVRNLRCGIEGRRVLVLGAGGAARGAILPILEQNPALLVVANRDVDKAQAIVAALASRGALATTSYAALGEQMPFDLIVNATSASRQGEGPPVPAASFAPGALAYDMGYGQGLTPFLRAAQDAGAGRLADGVGMLVEQAAEAFAWWRGVYPDTQPVIAALTIPLV